MSNYTNTQLQRLAEARKLLKARNRAAKVAEAAGDRMLALEIRRGKRDKELQEAKS